MKPADIRWMFQPVVLVETWHLASRRTFTLQYPICGDSRRFFNQARRSICLLPAGHDGDHAGRVPSRPGFRVERWISR